MSSTEKQNVSEAPLEIMTSSNENLGVEETLDQKPILPDEKPSLSNDDFEQLQRDFTEAVKYLGEDVNNQKFKKDYERMFETLNEARNNEIKLLDKLREIQLELSSSSSKMQAAMKISHSDRITIANLKKEVKKAWQVVEDATDRENRSKELIAQLKIEVSELQQNLQQTATASIGQEQSVNELLRQKEDLTKDRDIQMNQITQLRTEISEATEKSRVLEVEKTQLMQEVREIRELLAQKKSESDKESRIKDRLERDLKDARMSIEQKNTEIRSKQDIIMRAKDEVSKLEQAIKDQKTTIERTASEIELLQNRLSKLQQEYDDQVATTNHLLSENQDKTSTIKTKEAELSRLKDELKSSGRIKESLQRKTRILEDEKQRFETERTQLKSLIVSLEKDIELYRRTTENDKRQIEELIRERDLISRNLQKSTSTNQKQLNLVRIHEQSKRNLDQDINLYKEEIARQRKTIAQMEKEKDKYLFETAQIQTQLVSHIDTIKLRGNEIYEYKRKIIEVESKLKQQQGLYETVRADRNVYSKNLVEAQEEINEMKRKLKITAHQIEQLKDEIQTKNNAIAKEHNGLILVGKEKDALKNEIQRLKQQFEITQQYLQNQQNEEQKLRSIATEADHELTRQKKELEAVIQERDILSAQLVRRNDELALLYEKVKIQQSSLNKGELQYRERIDEIRNLRLEIKKLREDFLVLQNETQGQDALRNEIIRLEKNIVREKSRVKVLEEELQNPINIHRWRKLEGTDPEQHELITKVQNLQKKLISKTEEVVSKEMVIRQKEHLCEELTKILARQPGPEVVDQVSQYQHAIKDKTSQLKAMASELNMYQSQVTDYRNEIEYLQREMQNLRKRYFERKRAPKTKITAVDGSDEKTRNMQELQLDLTVA